MQCEVEQSLLFEKWVLGAGVLSLPQPNDDLLHLEHMMCQCILGLSPCFTTPCLSIRLNTISYLQQRERASYLKSAWIIVYW